MKISFEFKNILNVNVLIALALVASTFTQVRFSNLPIGVSDLLFLSFIIYSIGLFSLSLNNLHSEKIMSLNRCLIIPILLFLFFYLLLLFMGTIYGSYLISNGVLMPLNSDGSKMMTAPYHNLMAYSYVTIIFLTLYIKSDIDIAALALYTFLLLSLCTGCFYVISKFSNNFFGIDLFYLWTDRLQLFTKSPNHLADFIAPLPLFLLYFAKNSKSIFFTSLLILLAILTLFAGFESQSKSTILGWIIAFGYLLLYYVFRRKYVTIVVSLSVTIFILFLIFIQIYYSDSIINALQNYMDSGGDQRGGMILIPRTIIYDILIRLELIFNAMEVGNMSPVIGLGAGASSGVLEPFLGRESHNHISEIIMSSGYFGLISYLALMLYVFVKISRVRKPILMSAFIVITVTTLFHMQLRQPLFWFYILFLLYFSSNVSKKEQKMLI